MSILNTIGKTPLIKVENIYAKLETYNPSGSVKDRMAYYMLEQAEKRGELQKGQKIIEVTSGNTGIAFSMISAIKGYTFTAIMPESMSIQRRKIMKKFGAELILTPAEDDMDGAVVKYQEIISENPDAWLPKQFENPDNVTAHQNGLGKEIIRQSKGKIDAFVAGGGTGGTVVGVAKALKEFNPQIKIFIVEPEESAVLSGKEAGLHGIQGIGEGFVPQIIKDNIKIMDGIVTIKTADAVAQSRKLMEEKGIMVGISSGANFLAAKQLSEKFENVVTIFADRGERYLN